MIECGDVLVGSIFSATLHLFMQVLHPLTLCVVTVVITPTQTDLPHPADLLTHCKSTSCHSTSEIYIKKRYKVLFHVPKIKSCFMVQITKGNKQSSCPLTPQVWDLATLVSESGNRVMWCIVLTCPCSHHKPGSHCHNNHSNTNSHTPQKTMSTFGYNIQRKWCPRFGNVLYSCTFL